MFSHRFAQHVANRYRKRGLDKTAGRMVDLIARNGVQGATVLEVGGGVGEIQIELLKRGAVRATNLELSPAYETEAQRLLAEHGLTDRVERRMLDVATDPDAVEPADIVVLHRVVCCYPDYVKLLTAVADRTRRQLVFSHPPRNALSRAVIAVQNLLFRMSRREFRVFAHPPAEMLGVLTSRGLRADAMLRRRLWQIASAVR